jgi:hypothetical protein
MLLRELRSLGAHLRSFIGTQNWAPWWLAPALGTVWEVRGSPRCPIAAVEAGMAAPLVLLFGWPAATAGLLLAYWPLRAVGGLPAGTSWRVADLQLLRACC